MLSIFQVVTLENWAEGLLYPLNAKGFVGLELYFSFIILIGGFWLLNLTITVLTSEYEKARDNHDKEKADAAAAEAIGHTDGAVELLQHSATMPVNNENVILPPDIPQSRLEKFLTQGHESSTRPASRSSPTSVSRSVKRSSMVRQETDNEMQPLKIDRQSQRQRNMSIEKQMEKGCFVLLNSAKRKTKAGYDALNATAFMTGYRAWRGRFVEPIVSHKFFEGFIFIVILMNTFVLAIETPFQSAKKENVLSVMNQVFTIIFASEMVLKMLGMGWPTYFAENWNKFDCLIVISSLVEFTQPASEEGGEESALKDASALRALRVFRALRVTKAIKHLKATQTIISVFEAASEEYVIFMGLLFLSIFIIVLTGTQLFAGQYTHCNKDYSEGNFDSFGSAFLLVFRVLTLDDWNSLTFGGVECTGGNWVILFYFLIWMILGNFMLLNLFLAILIRSFEKVKGESVEEKKRTMREEQRLLDVKMALEVASKETVMHAIDRAVLNVSSVTGGLTEELMHGTGRRIVMSKLHGYFDSEVRFGKTITNAKVGANGEPNFCYSREDTILTPEEVAEEEGVRDEVDKVYKGLSERFLMPIQRFVYKQKYADKKKLAKIAKNYSRGGSEMADDMDDIIGAVASAGDKAHITRQLRSATSFQDAHHDLVDAKPISGHSLKCLGHTNHFRIICHEFCHHRYFNNVILFSILISSACLAFEGPTMSADLKSDLLVLDRIFTYIFTVEMCLKVIALGFVNTRYAYLKDTWNRLDFTIVVSSLMDLILSNTTSGVEIGFLKVIRLLRVLRPLRTIKRNQNLSQVVNAIMGSFMSVLNVLVLVTLVGLVFGILGMGLLGGRLWHCNDDMNGTIMEQQYCVGNFTINYQHEYPDGTIGMKEVLLNRTWQNEMYHFDDFLNSTCSLFVISTMEGWYGIAETGMHATEIGEAPDPNTTSELNMGFFIMFICLESFMGIGLFVGVLCDYFNTVSNSGGKSAFITEEQSEWIEAQKSVLFSRAVRRSKRPENPIRRLCWLIIKSSIFNFFVMLLIVFSILMLSLNHKGERETWVNNVALINKVCTWLFAIEAALKITGEGPHLYFKRWSCCFDFGLVAGTLLDESFDIAQGNAGVLFVLRIFRVFRVTRILRLLGPNSGFSNLFKVIMYSLPSVWNVAALLIMIYFTFAVLGVALFGNTNIDENGEFYNPQPAENPGQYGVGVNPDANFRTFEKAFITLFRISTGDNWQLLHRDTHNENTYGLPFLSTLYYFFFVVICQYVTLNLFVAVLLDQFSIAKSESKEITRLRDEMINFVDVWGIFDPDATQFVNVKQLKFILIGLKPPLGLGPGVEVTEKNIEDLLWEADIPIYRSPHINQLRVFYKDVLFRLSRVAFGATISHDLNLGDEPDVDSPEALALERLRSQRLIFSTREYVAVKRIIKCIKRKQGKGVDSFTELVFSTVKRQQELSEHLMEIDDFELFEDETKKKNQYLTHIQNFSKAIGKAFRD